MAENVGGGGGGCPLASGNNFKFPLLNNETMPREIPKNGMLYGDYLHVNFPIFNFKLIEFKLFANSMPFFP